MRHGPVSAQPYSSWQLGLLLITSLPYAITDWLDPPPPVTDADRPHLDSAEDPESPNYDTLNYLAHRLMPLHDPSPVMPFQDGQPTASPANRHDGEIVPGQDGERRTDERRRGKEVVFVGCNRIGEEKGQLPSFLIIMSGHIEPKRLLMLCEYLFPSPLLDHSFLTGELLPLLHPFHTQCFPFPLQAPDSWDQAPS